MPLGFSQARVFVRTCKEEAQFLRSQNQHLQRELDTYRPAWYRASVRIDKLNQQVQKLKAENKVLKQKVKDLTLAAASAEQAGVDESSPAKIAKPSVKRRRKRPGRKPGHPAALRPMPDHVDVDQQVPLPKDPDGRDSCPCCNACLLELEDHQRVVEDIIPAKVLVKRYHTRSGWCPCCRKRVESRAIEQPPAANIPHGQLGLNALATAMVLRIAHRLPFRQVAAVFANLPELSVSPGAIVRQVQRVAEWFDQDYEKLMLQLRCAPIVHADETGWRVDGKFQDGLQKAKVPGPSAQRTKNVGGKIGGLRQRKLLCRLQASAQTHAAAQAAVGETGR